MLVSIAQLMAESGVAFGTSGARGLVTAMNDLVCYAYTRAFLQHLVSSGQVASPQVAIGADLRPSSGRIASACGFGIASADLAIGDALFEICNCGNISSPALALYGLSNKCATIMITGSHIPDDRNGIKFTTPGGEITKADEDGIKSQVIEVPDHLFSDGGSLQQPFILPEVSSQAREQYRVRFRDFFGCGFLAGAKIGVYQHSAVLRDDLPLIFESLGAEVATLGRSEVFVPVDTEAIRPEDRLLAQQWAEQARYDAIVSVDGDSDRPLMSDEQGNWMRGDVIGIMAARFLGAQAVVAPVSCNTALEGSGYFPVVRRTRIGSPFVIAGMAQELAKNPSQVVVGYEANGGFLQASSVSRGGKILSALPTRDAVIVHIAVLGLARERGLSLSQLLRELPPRFTYSERIKDVPTKDSARFIEELGRGSKDQQLSAIEKVLGIVAGTPVAIDTTDGMRISFHSGEIIHLRPSGNAPELRCYTEAGSLERAEEINEAALRKVQHLITVQVGNSL